MLLLATVNEALFLPEDFHAFFKDFWLRSSVKMINLMIFPIS